MSTKHTPGPWRKGYCPDAPKYWGRAILDHNGEAIALMPLEGGEDQHRNADLIAAAPELLEALKLMVKQFTKVPSSFRDSDARVKAHAAIAKATGGAA